MLFISNTFQIICWHHAYRLWLLWVVLSYQTFIMSSKRFLKTGGDTIFHTHANWYKKRLRFKRQKTADLHYTLSTNTTIYVQYNIILISAIRAHINLWWPIWESAPVSNSLHSLLAQITRWALKKNLQTHSEEAALSSICSS